jgi:hypothetical protein
MKANFYNILASAIEEGTRYGHNKAYKYTTNPDEELVITEITNAIMNSICEYIIFKGEFNE